MSAAARLLCGGTECNSEFAHGSPGRTSRELIEETGWEAGRLEVLMCGPTTPGTCDEIVALVCATQLRRTGGGGGVAQEGEEIVVHEIPRLGMRDWLAQRSREGWLVDVKSYAGLVWLEAP